MTRRRPAASTRPAGGGTLEDLFEARARLVVSEHAPDADLDAMAVLYNLLRTAAKVVHDLETNVHRPFGHTWASFRVLFNVWVAGPIAPRELARLSSVSRASISSVLNTLEERGLVVRKRSADDRRSVEVELTERGRAHMVEYWKRHNERERAWAASLDAAQRRALVDALHTLALHGPADARDLREQPAPRAAATRGRERRSEGA